MTSIHISEETTENIHLLLHQKVVAVDVPDGKLSSDYLPLRNLSAIRLTLEDTSVFFLSVVSADLTEDVEVFIVDITSSLELRRFPRGPLVTWQPLTALANGFVGSKIDDMRVLSAKWKVVTGGQGQSLYGSSPYFLQYDLPGDTTSHYVEDGLILFFSSGYALIVSTINTLAGTLVLSQTAV